MYFTRVGNQDLKLQRLADAVEIHGFVCKVRGNSLRNIRIDPSIKGYTYNARSGKRGRYPSWEDWVEFNETVNRWLDHWSIKCVVKTFPPVGGGAMIVRDLDGAKTEEDWYESHGRLQAGTLAQPHLYCETWQHE